MAVTLSLRSIYATTTPLLGLIATDFSILGLSIMRHTTTTSKGDAERILSVMERGRQYSTSALATACHIPPSRMQPALHKLVEARRLVQHVNRKRYWYTLPEDNPAQSSPALSHRMETQLTGYDQQVRQFMALCMLTRPSVTTIKPSDGTDQQRPRRAQSRTR